MFFYRSHFFDFIRIRLIGVMIPATLPSGIEALYNEGYAGLALLVFFCASLAPFILCCSVVGAHIALRHNNFSLMRYSLLLISKLKPWVMIDVFLVSIAVSCFKLIDISDVFVGPGLYGLVLLQIFTVLLISRISVRRYWEAWRPETDYPLEIKHVHCHNCHLSQPESSNCIRCHEKLYHRKPKSIERTWAYLLAATVSIIPANFLPISVLLTNGKRLEDTIFSGVASLINSGMVGQQY